MRARGFHEAIIARQHIAVYTYIAFATRETHLMHVKRVIRHPQLYIDYFIESVQYYCNHVIMQIRKNRLISLVGNLNIKSKHTCSHTHIGTLSKRFVTKIDRYI